MKKSIKIFITLLIFIGILFLGKNVMAATASITVNKSTITVGDTITATVKYTAAAWNLKVSADSGLTTSSTTQYANSTETAENESKSFTVKYTATKAGTLKIYLKGDITDEASNKADSINKSVSVTVKEKTTTTDKKDENSASSNTNNTNNNTKPTTQTKSNNAYLSTLGVTPKEYDFSGFSKTKTSYSVTVPNDVDSLKVSYKAADSKATVKVSGNTGFEVGTNNSIKVKVTAEDGKTTKTYTIKVTKLAATEELPGNLIEENEKNEGLYLTSLKLDGIEISPEFSKEKYSYTATLEDASVTEINVDAKANKDNAKIEITGNTNLIAGENTINILVTLDGSEAQTVYQIVLTKTEDIATTDSIENTNSNDSGLINSLMSNVKKYVIIAIVVIVLIIVAVIVLIILLRKENKRLNEEYEETSLENNENDSNEYNVFQNDANEFNKIEDIFNEKVDGQSVEYLAETEEKPKRREKGKHSL